MASDPLHNNSGHHLISIGEAAALIGVSLETIRRFERQGLLTSIRHQGKRYFNRQAIVDFAAQRPLSISEAAALLGTSISKLRALEKAGSLVPERTNGGQRVYPRALLEEYKNRPQVADPLKTPSFKEKVSTNNGLVQKEPAVAEAMAGRATIYQQLHGVAEETELVPTAPSLPVPPIAGAKQPLWPLSLLVASPFVSLGIPGPAGYLAAALLVLAGSCLLLIRRYFARGSATAAIRELITPSVGTAFAEHATTAATGEVLLPYRTYKKLRHRILSAVGLSSILLVLVLVGLKTLPVPTYYLLGPVLGAVALSALYALYSLLRLVPAGSRRHTLKTLFFADPRAIFARYAPTGQGGAVLVGYTTYKRMALATKLAVAGFVLLAVSVLAYEAYQAKQAARDNLAATRDQLAELYNVVSSGQGNLQEELKKLAAQSLQPAPTVNEDSLTQRILDSVTANLPDPPQQIVREKTETKVIERTIIEEGELSAIQIEEGGTFAIKDDHGTTFVEFDSDQTITVEESGTFNIDGTWQIDGTKVTATASEINTVSSLDDATYLVLSSNSTLANERVLTAGSGISITDAGGNSTATLSIATDGVTEAMLKVVDTATDEECFTFETTTGDFEWQSCGTGDITAVGSMTSGDVFADSTADDDWLGLGSGAGRIEFDDQATDEVNILNAVVGINDTSPDASLEVVNDGSGDSFLVADTNDGDTTPFVIQADGDVGIGTGSPSAALHVVRTTEQLRLGYDTSNYVSSTVSSTGIVTLDAIGTGASFILSDALSVPGAGTDSERFGASATAAGARAVAIGKTASADVDDAVAVGYGATADTTSAGVAVGKSAISGAQNAIAIGSGTSATGINSVVIGPGASSDGGVVIGGGAVGSSAAVAVGSSATVAGSIDGIAIGNAASATSLRAIAIGNGASAAHQSIVMGVTANSTANFQFVAGDVNTPMSDVYFSEGVVDDSPIAWTLNGTGGSGTNIAGGALQLAGGKGTGNAAGGDILFQTSDAGSSGTTLQSLTTKMTLTELGNLGIGSTSPEALLEVQGAEATDAVIALDADDGDDAADTWFVKSLASGNSLSFVNDATEVAAVSSAGNLQIDGDLTISGDDLVMGTNTSGFILVADGTNFNPVAVSGDATISSAGVLAIANNVLDFAEFEDTLDLDAATEINLGANAFTLDLNSTGDFIIQDNATTFFTFRDDSTLIATLPTTGSVNISTSTTSQLGDLSGVLMLDVNSTTASNAAFFIDYTVDNGTAAGTDLYAARIRLNQNDADADLFGLEIESETSANSTTDSFECLLCLTNARAATGAVMEAIRISDTSASAGSIATAIDINTSNVTTDIELQNDEVIHNNTDGTIAFTDGTNTLFSIVDQGTVGNISATGQIAASDGVVTEVVAGACADTSFTTDTDGLVCIDSTNGRFYFRYGGAWHYAAQTAGFQIPNLVWNGRNEVEGLNVGDYVIGKLDQRLEDGALHGVYVRFDLETELSKLLQTKPALFTALLDRHIASLEEFTLPGALSVQGNATIAGNLLIGGELTVSNQQAGHARIPAGSTTVTITYTKPFSGEPVVQVTPKGESAGYWVDDESKTGFTIRLAKPQTHPAAFNWLSLSVDEAVITTGDSPAVPNEPEEAGESTQETAAAPEESAASEETASAAEPVPAAEPISLPQISEEGIVPLVDEAAPLPEAAKVIPTQESEISAL